MILLNLDPSNAVVTGYGPNDTVICLCDATIGAFEISLPEADGVENVTFIFIRKDATENAITIKGRNGQNINGAESIELNEHAIVIPANNSYYDLSTFSSFRTSSLLIKEGIEEPPTPPDGYIRLYSDRAHGNDLFFKFDDGSIYHLPLNPFSGGAI
jgi:hypothetical protein